MSTIKLTWPFNPKNTHDAASTTDTRLYVYMDSVTRSGLPFYDLSETARKESVIQWISPIPTNPEHDQRLAHTISTDDLW